MGYKSAGHLPPDRLPTLTPPTMPEAIVITKEINGWPGSRLGADRGQGSEPIHSQLDR